MLNKVGEHHTTYQQTDSIRVLVLVSQMYLDSWSIPNDRDPDAIDRPLGTHHTCMVRALLVPWPWGWGQPSLPSGGDSR